MIINFLHLTDGYKLDHRRQYPDNTTLVYSNFTPRSSRIPDIDKVVFFGLQYFIIEFLCNQYNNGFFKRDKDEVTKNYLRRINNYLGPNKIGIEHIEALHDLGYLPIRIKALKEGSLVPIGVPMFTVQNTHKDFAWLTNYLETLISCELWKPCVVATLAFEYRKNFEEHAKRTGYDPNFIQWQGHDFSFRGMSGIYDAMKCGAAHLLSFTGTDTLSAIDFIEQYYFGDSDVELIGGSVPATEHSVMCAGSKESEIETYRRLINKVYPDGIISIVSDTWDFWNVMTVILPALKEDILKREGRVVIRPDSGNPVDIICGISNRYEQLSDDYLCSDEVIPEVFEDILLDTVRDITPHGECGPCEFEATYIIKGCLYKAKIHNIQWNRYNKQYYYIDMYDKAKITVEKLEWKPEDKGAFELLWDTFGGTVNEKGFKELNPKVGLIYGDAITLDRQKEIISRLEAKGFCANNLVLGIGSYTYQYNTRDTFGMAMKSTYVEINYEGQEIFKDPITDSGIKKSHKGLLMVYEEDDTFKVKDQCTSEEEQSGSLEVVFENSMIKRIEKFSTIKERLLSKLVH